MNSYTRDLTISSGSQATEVFDLGNAKTLAIFFPGTMTGTTVKLKAHKTMADAGSYVARDDGAGDYSITVAAGKCVPLDANSMAIPALRYLSIESQSAEAADRALTVLVKE